MSEITIVVDEDRYATLNRLKLITAVQQTIGQTNIDVYPDSVAEVSVDE